MFFSRSNADIFCGLSVISDRMPDLFSSGNSTYFILLEGLILEYG